MRQKGKKNERAAIVVALAVSIVLIVVPIVVLETVDKEKIAFFEI